MNTYAEKKQENNKQSVASIVSQTQSNGKTSFQFVDNRPQSIQMKRLQEVTNNSAQAKRSDQLQAMADNYSKNQKQAIQRKLIIQDPQRREVSWAKAYLTYVYPSLQEIMASTGASEGDIIKLVKKYDQNDVSFPNSAKIIEVLKQELIIELLERQSEEDELESSTEQIIEGPLSEEKELDSDLSAIMDSIRGNKLYRSMRTAEIEKAISDQKLEAIGSFFSPSKAYSLQYLGGQKAKGGTYDGCVEITLSKPVYKFYASMLDEGKVHFQNAGKAKELFKKTKTKKGAPYLLKLEGSVLNIQLVKEGEISELNSAVSSITKLE